MTPEEIYHLKKITLIVLSFDHSSQLELSIEHWRDLPVTVHILDGSDKPYFTVGSLPGASNITYSHIPRESNETPLENYKRRAKLITSLSLSKYAALIADDDFFTSIGLIRAVEHLEKHSDIDAVIGKCARFDLRNKRIIWTRKHKEWSTNENSFDRSLLKRLSNDVALGTVYYGVLRSEKLKKIHFRANEINFSNQKYNEVLAHRLGMAYCRVALLDTFLWLRNAKVTRPKTADQGSFLGTFEEDDLATRVFEGAFKDIDNSIVPEVIREQAAIETIKLKNFALARANKNQVKKLPSKKKTAEILIKKLIIRAISKSPHAICRLISRVANSDNSLKLQNALPPDFEERKYFERLLLMPREELRLRANI